MNKLFTAFILCLFLTSCFAQVNTDSLLIVIKSTNNDSVKFENYIKIIQDVRFSDLEKTKEYCEEVYQIGKRYKPEHVTAMADYYLAYYYKIKGDYEKAISLYNNVSNYGHSSGNMNFEAAALNDIAGIYDIEGKSQEALQTFFKVRDLFIETKNINGQLVVENNIGLLYQNLKEHDNALKYYKVAFLKAIEFDSKYNEEMLAGNIASIYITLEKMDSAVYYTKRCLKIAKELKYERSIGYANNLLATIGMKNGNFREGLEYGLIALESYQKIDDKVLLGELYFVLSELYYGINDFKNAKLYTQLGIDIGNDLNYDEGKRKGYFTLSKIYENQGNYKDALKLYKEFASISDTISDLLKVNAVNELEIKYETANKDLEIRNQENELIKKTSQRNIYMAGLIFALLIALFLWYKNSLQKRLSTSRIQSLESEQKFLAADFILQGQEEERKRIATDLHDGLGGILATAKLQLQNIHKEIDKLHDLNLMTKAEDLIGDAYSEVRRIAHDMMPSSLINLGFKSAVEDLADKINLSNKLIVKTQFYSYSDDIVEKKAVNLYRVIQEAVNNSLKYANANNIIIQFSETDNAFLLTIEDDGVGFDLKDNNDFKGLGINNIKSRINYLNGEFNMWSEIGKGTGYDIVIPK